MNGMDRRHFLKVMLGAGGALIVGFPARHALAASPPVPLALLGDSWTRLNAFVSIEPNGRTLIGARAPEIGQGVRTALPRIIADELDADWTRVEVIPLSLGVEDNDQDQPHWTYGPQFAGGGRNIPAAWADLRRVGATARWLLCEAAAQQWNLPATRLSTSSGRVIAPDGRRLDYGDLASAAAQIDLPNHDIPLKAATDYLLIGQPAGDVDARAIVTGRLQYASDSYWGDGYVAVVARCPYVDGELDHLDDTAARAVAGVEKIVVIPARATLGPIGQVPLAPGVAVLARDTWSALKGRAALALRWRPRHGGAASTTLLAEQAATLLKGEPTARVLTRGDVSKALKAAAHRVEANYEVPFVAHATMEPMHCLARVTADRAHLIVPTQEPRAALEVVRKLTGLDPGSILIELPRIGGGYGRRLDNDYVAEAVLLAQAADKAIKLMWTREDDLTHDVFRPFGLHHLEAGVDRKGRITAWRHHLASTSRLWHRDVPVGALWQSELQPDAWPVVSLPAADLAWFALDFPLWRGAWRSPAHVSSVFAIESFLDEIAHASHQDPLKLRLALLAPSRQISTAHGALDTSRMANVLEAAAHAIDWGQRAPAGHGRGVACAFVAGSYCAHAFEVSLQGGHLRFHRAVAAVDVGRVVNPLGLEAQITGGTMDALSTALKLEITVAHGIVQQRNFPDYPIARRHELPREISVIQMASAASPSGAEDLGVPSAAPALANAVFAARGIRIRTMPIARQLAHLG